MKRLIYFFLFSALLLGFSGCNTFKGAAGGFTEGLTEGFTKDWAEAKKIDDWLQKHAW
jgi:hypothetical protein